MEKITITSMTAEHLDDIAEIEKECFSTPWSRKMLAEELYNDCAAYIVALDEHGTVIGYAGLLVAADEGYITNVAVRPQYRKKHIASQLLDVFMNFCDAHQLAFITLEVRCSNAPACGLYEKYGFAEAGRRKNYYDHPKEDAIIMTKFFERGEEQC